MKNSNIVATEGYQEVSRFIEWLGEQGISFWDMKTDNLSLNKPDEFMDEYFGVDRQELEKERKEMLEDMRKLNAERKGQK
jgi:hypothetical protein